MSQGCGFIGAYILGGPLRPLEPPGRIHPQPDTYIEVRHGVEGEGELETGGRSPRYLNLFLNIAGLGFGGGRKVTLGAKEDSFAVNFLSVLGPAASSALVAEVGLFKTPRPKSTCFW